jgi:hypothetical protein
MVSRWLPDEAATGVIPCPSQQSLLDDGGSDWPEAEFGTSWSKHGLEFAIEVAQSIGLGGAAALQAGQVRAVPIFSAEHVATALSASRTSRHRNIPL